MGKKIKAKNELIDSLNDLGLRYLLNGGPDKFGNRYGPCLGSMNYSDAVLQRIEALLDTNLTAEQIGLVQQLIYWVAKASRI